MSKKVMMDQRFMAKREEITGVLHALKGVEVCTFEPSDGFNASRKAGIVGQTLKSVVPSAVEVDGMGYHYVYLDQVIPALVAAINELASEVSSLKRAGKRASKRDESATASAE